MIRSLFARRNAMFTFKEKFRKGAVDTGQTALEIPSPLRNQPHEGANVKDIRSLLRRGLLAGAMVFAVGGGTLAVASAPAGASNTQMTAWGSFTTFFMMHNLFPELNDINPIPEGTGQTQSIAPDSLTCPSGITFGTGTGQIQPPNGSGQGKTDLAAEEAGGTYATTYGQGCADFSRSSSPPAPHAETLTNGGTETGDPSPSHLDYYAYALDGVGPLVGSDAPTTVWQAGSDVGPGNGLTLAQIQSIYECNTTNWDQLTIDGQTGVNSPIVLFWPQSGSGTRAVYTDILGFDPTKPGTSPSNCNANDQPITGFANSVPNEENAEDGIVYQNSLGVPAADLAINYTGGTLTGSTSVPAGSVTAAAMYIYSAGKFSTEWNDTTDNTTTANNVVDQAETGSTNTMGNFEAATLNMATVENTSGSGEAYVDLTPQSGHFNQNTNRGTYAIDGNTVSEANEWYSNIPGTDTADASGSNASIPGVRYVYNVADTALPGYNGAKDLIGFDNQANGSKSALCNGDLAPTITTSGFLPLTTGASAPAGSDAAGATCREFPGLSFPSQGGSIHWTTPTFDSRDH